MVLFRARCRGQKQTVRRSLLRHTEVRLTLHDPGDVRVARLHGMRRLRLVRLARITREAWDQQACLTQADVGVLLGVDRGTVRRLVTALREEGTPPPLCADDR